jgi:glutathione S-transferase
MLKLYHSHTSPYVRKVMVLLHETGQLADVELTPAGGTPVDPGTMPVAQNPLGKVPTLERRHAGADRPV